MTNSDFYSRSFWFVVYQKDISDFSRFVDILETFHCPIFVSPLHIDSDTPHYHVMFMFSGKKSINSFERKLKVAFADIPFFKLEICSDKVSCARYLCHLDNKFKTHYSPSNVVEISGSDYSQYSYDSRTKDSVFKDILKDIDSYSSPISFDSLLMLYLSHDDLKFTCMTSPRYSFIIREFLNSHNIHSSQ